MNILQQQDALKSLPDQALQQELLKPSGSMPGFLVLTELQRRKSMRDNYAAIRAGKPPNSSMAEEFAKGVGSADVGNYAPAVRGFMPGPMPGGEPIMNPTVQPAGNASAPQGDEVQAFAAGGPVGGDFLASLINQPFTSQFSNPFSPLSGDANFNPEADRGKRIYKGPGTPSPLGIEQNYFSYARPAPVVPEAASGIAAAPIALAIQAAIDGSANGATGAAGAGSVGAAVGEGASVSGGDAGTVGASVGGNAGTDSGTGDDGGGTYASGGPVGMGLIKSALSYQRGGGVMPFMDEDNAERNVPDVPETYVRDTRTMKQKFWDAMGVPSKDAGSALIEKLKGLPWQEYYDKNRAMVDKEREMESQFWTPRPGLSLGQSISDKVMGRVPDTNVGEATSPFPSPPPPPPPQGVAAVYPEPTEAMGVPNNVGPDQEVSDVPSVPDTTVPGRPGVVAPNMAPVTGGGDAPGRGGLNIGGEGLESYINQVRALQRPDGLGDIERRVLADRAELEKGRESDKGLALLTAGLGIMGGTSPFAAVNIGQGAMAGVKQYNEATREQRAALRDLRNAENQITIARANRDERQLEKGISLYARAQENLQRSLDRQSREGISSADRAANRAIREKELESIAADRRERREQAQISDLGTRANQYGREADAIDMKIATLQSNLAMSPDAAGEIARLKSQSEALRAQATQYGKMYERSIIEREVKQGKLAAPKTESEYKALKPGTRYLHIDGQIKVKP